MKRPAESVASQMGGLILSSQVLSSCGTHPGLADSQRGWTAAWFIYLFVFFLGCWFVVLGSFGCGGVCSSAGRCRPGSGDIPKWDMNRPFSPFSHGVMPAQRTSATMPSVLHYNSQFVHLLQLLGWEQPLQPNPCVFTGHSPAFGTAASLCAGHCDSSWVALDLVGLGQGGSLNLWKWKINHTGSHKCTF